MNKAIQCALFRLRLSTSILLVDIEQPVHRPTRGQPGWAIAFVLLLSLLPPVAAVEVVPVTQLTYHRDKPIHFGDADPLQGLSGRRLELTKKWLQVGLSNG